jgi:autoinducer 2 (AI-2) kinase
MNFDIEKNFELLMLCISIAIKNAGIDGKDIAAISSASMREGIVLYDKDGKELWACANVDARAVEEVSQLKAISDDIEKEIYEVSGQTFALGALPRILWVKNNLPDVYEKVSDITMINDWIVYRLTGVLSLEPSNGCTTGMFSLKERKWQTSIAKKCGLKDNIYPEVNESGTAVARVKKDIADKTGLSQSCIVVSGGGDAQLGCIGVGAVKPGQAALFGGSFWQLEYNVDAPITDKEFRIRVNCHAVSDVWQYELLAFFPGLIMRWFRDSFCQLEKLIESQTGVDAYYLMDKAASHVPPGSNGLICTFSDVMNYISWKHAAPAFINFSIDSERFDKKVFYRAIMENAALVTLGHAKIIESITGKYPKDIIFASGASKSNLWCSIVSDVLGTVIRVPKIKEATALGTAICAGVGAGIYSSISEGAEKFCTIEKVYEPNAENNKIYKEIFDKWRQVYKTELENADKGLTNHMWKAPGI